MSRIEELAREIISQVKRIEELCRRLWVEAGYAASRVEERYRNLCLEAGNANTMIYQLLYDEGPLHFYRIVERTKLSRSSVHYSLVELRRAGLIRKDERTDLWSVA